MLSSQKALKKKKVLYVLFKMQKVLRNYQKQKEEIQLYQGVQHFQHNAI